MKRSLLFCMVLLSFYTLSATDVSGSQSGSWSPANNPYNMVGNITVPSGMNLTIHPGVIVNVMGNYTFTAQGTLYATGTEGDSVRFVNGQTNPDALWQGIRLESPSQGNLIQLCYIENAEYGINSINSPSSINNNRFYKNKKGIQLYAIGAANPALVIVGDNVIERSIQNGILIVQNSNAQILNNELRYNGTGTQYMAAIQLSNQSTGGSNSPLIAGNHIHHNFKQGITAWDIVGANAIQPDINSNLIEYNLTGIYLLNSSGYVYNNVIRNNFIAGDTNSGAGVMVAGATSMPYFENNDIYGNYTGFYIGNNANPCLGNMAINHAWAQGENQIYDNIDGQGILHSVYTYSYTNPNITIYAENNYWGTNNALEIPAGIQDHADDAALPTVDFDPIYPLELETPVLGTATYTGSFTLENPLIQFVSAVTGEVIEDYPLTLGEPFIYYVHLTEGFYVVFTAEVAGMDKSVYGCYGGLIEPAVLYPGDLILIDVGQVFFNDEQPPRYQQVGTAQQEGTHLIYPVYNSFFVYRWEYINWLYEEGDYLYIKRHERFNDAENLIFNFPDGTIWDKVANIGYNDAWMRTEILDDSGAQRQSVFRYKRMMGEPSVIPEETGAYDLIIQRDSADNSLICMRMLYPDVRRLYHYENDYLYRAEDIVTNVTGEHLITGNYWNFMPILPVYQPTYLGYDSIEHEQYFEYLTLIWHAPMDDAAFNWTHYRIYNFDQLFAEVPFGQNYWHTETLAYGSYQFTVRAFDGTDLSAPTNSVLVFWTANDDPENVPPALCVQPNPASLTLSGTISINLSGSKDASGNLAIYNLRGQLIRNLPLQSGTSSLTWDLRDERGSLCSSGIYFLKAELLADNAGRINLSKRLVLMK